MKAGASKPALTRPSFLSEGGACRRHSATWSPEARRQALSSVLRARTSGGGAPTSSSPPRACPASAAARRTRSAAFDGAVIVAGANSPTRAGALPFRSRSISAWHSFPPSLSRIRLSDARPYSSLAIAARASHSPVWLPTG